MRIAIVDDISAVSDKMKKILQNFAEIKYMNFEIFCFESGESFLNIFENNSFDIILWTYAKGVFPSYL